MFDLQRMGDLWLMLTVENFGVSLVGSLHYPEKQLMLKTKLTVPISQNYSGNIFLSYFIYFEPIMLQLSINFFFSEIEVWRKDRQIPLKASR